MNWYLPSFYCHTLFRCLENAWSMEYQLRKKSIVVEDNSIVTINSCTSRDVLLPFICDMDKLLLSVPILVDFRILKYILKKIKLLSNLVLLYHIKFSLQCFVFCIIVRLSFLQCNWLQFPLLKNPQWCCISCTVKFTLFTPVAWDSMPCWILSQTIPF